VTGERFIFSNSIAYSDTADYLISLSTDIGLSKTVSPQSRPSLFVNGMPYSMSDTAQRLGLSLHTKKSNQDPAVWNLAVQEIQSEIMSGKDFIGNSIQQSSFKFLITDRVNFRLSSDILPGSKNYLALFEHHPYLDILSSIDVDLTPFDENFNTGRFDSEVNEHLPDERIVYFTTGNNVSDLAENLYQYRTKSLSIPELEKLLRGQPWYLVKAFILEQANISKLSDPDKFVELEPKIKTFQEKVAGKLNKTDDNLVNFDLGMLYLSDYNLALEQYTNVCDKLGITPNINLFSQYRNTIWSHRQNSVGIDSIPDPWCDTFTSIAQVILNRNDIYLDSSLSELGWNIAAQIALRCSSNSNLDLNFTKYETVKDLINQINI